MLALLTSSRSGSPFPGDGEMAARMRDHDWEATPLGRPETWPASLCTAVRILLSSRYAMWLGWGPDLRFFYNDTYRRDTLGTKHPRALGQPAATVWAEVWPDVADRVEAVLRRGETTWDEALLLFLERDGYREETYHTFSYSPLPDDHGATGGLLCVVTEETERIVAERRDRLLQALTTATAHERSPEAVLHAAAAVFADHGEDLPAAAFYLADEHGALRRVALAGVDADHPAAGPAHVAPESPVAPDSVAPASVATEGVAAALARVRATTPPIVATLPADGPPVGPFGAVPRRAAVVPLPRQGGTLAGAAVLALTPFRPYDERGETLIGLVAGTLTTALGTASMREGLARARTAAEASAGRTERLQSVTAALATALTAGAVADAVLEHGLAAMGAYAGSLALVTPSGEALQVVRADGYPPDVIAAWPTIPLDAPVPLADSVRHGESLWVGSPAEIKARYGAIVDLVSRTGTHALAVLPLITDGRTMGAIALSFREAQAFEPEGRALAEAFATQAALALDRARLFEAERGSRERALFRAALAETLTPLPGADAIQTQTVQMLGRHLGVRRAFYAEADPDGEHLVVAHEYCDGVPAAAGRYRVADFGRTAAEAFAAGRVLAVEDIARLPLTDAERAAHAAVQVRASLSVPLFDDGRIVAAIGLRHDRPREWTPDEIALVQETAERTWAAVTRTRAEAALAEREARYRALFTSIDEGYALVEILRDADGRATDYRFLEANPLFGTLTGIEPDAIGRTARDLVPGLEDHWVETYGRVAETGEAVRFESGSDAMGRWFSVYAAPVGPRGSALVALVFTEITERRRAETQLRESEQQLRLASEAGHVGAFALDVPTGHLWVSPQLLAIYGLDTFDGRVETWLECVFPDDRPAMERLLVHARRGRQPEVRADFRIVRPDGSVRWVEIRAAVAFDEAGRALRVTGVNVDVTARKAAEALLRAREEAFRGMANVAPALLWVTDPDGACTFLSEAWYEFTGQGPTDGLGLGWTQAVHPDDRAAAGTTFLRASEARVLFETDFRLRRADGVYRWVIDTGRPWVTPDGEFLGYVGAVLDVHDRREAEAALVRANETLETRVAERTAEVRALSEALTMAEQRERERLSRVLHDDLQQVLFGLQLRTHALGAMAPPAVAEVAGAIASLAADALGTTRALAVELAPPVLRGEGLAEALRWLAVHAGQAYGLQVDAHALDDAPGLGEDARVLLFQVARELLLNVAKHARTDRAAITLTLDPPAAPGAAATLTLGVTDHGGGFHPEHLDADVPTGIGLSSLRDRLAHRGGALLVHAAPGHGAHVRAVLPFVLSDAPVDPPLRPRV